jgi:hypothetical protein
MAAGALILDQQSAIRNPQSPINPQSAILNPQ